MQEDTIKCQMSKATATAAAAAAAVPVDGDTQLPSRTQVISKLRYEDNLKQMASSIRIIRCKSFEFIIVAANDSD
jgi:hypothetical protein